MEGSPEYKESEAEEVRRNIESEVANLSDAELDKLAEEAFQGAEDMSEAGKLDDEYHKLRLRAKILNVILTDRLLKHKS